MRCMLDTIEPLKSYAIFHGRDGSHKRGDRRAARSADTVTSTTGCVNPDRGSAPRLSIESLALHIDNDLAQRFEQ